MSGAYGTIRGYIFKAPEQRESKGGATYTLATVKVRDSGDQNVFWTVRAFEQAGEALLQMREGAGVQIEGSIKVEPWTGRDGSPKVGLTILSRDVQPWTPGARKPEPERTTGHRRSVAEVAANGGSRSGYGDRSGSRGGMTAPTLDDDIPF